MPEDDESQEIRDYAHKAATQSILSSQTAKQAAEQAKIMQETGPYLTLGIQLALTILVFFGAGYWLDHHFNVTPLWTAILTTLGTIASLAYFIFTILRLQKNTETKSK